VPGTPPEVRKAPRPKAGKAPRPAPPPRRGRRLGRRIAIALALVAVGGGMAALRQATLPVVVVSVRSAPAPGRIELVAGDANLDRLARALADQGYKQLLVRSGEGWLLTRTLIVRGGAELDVEGELRLLSEPDGLVGLEARGGRLNIADAVVTSWDQRTRAPDTDPRDGRAFVLARDRASMSVLDSRLQQLGYAADERYGVTWRTPGTTGEVSGSTFTGNYYGVYTFDVEPMRIRDSVFERSWLYGLDTSSGRRGFMIENNHIRDNGKHGLLLAIGCSGAVVRNNEVYRNREHGIVVFSGSDDVLVQGNEVHENGQAGIDVNNSARTRVTDNLAYANLAGLSVHDKAAAVTVRDNHLSANRTDGLHLSGDATLAAAQGNLADYNYRAGAYLDGSSASLGPGNRLINNEIGVWIAGAMISATVFSNTIDDNVLDGIHLEQGATSLAIKGNAIQTNRKAAFSVEKRGAAQRFEPDNMVTGNQEGLERIRGTTE
jgi:parallel beta-helix repeat protein